MFSIEDYDYELDQKLIATAPVEPRDSSRLLVVDRQSGSLHEDRFSNIGAYLRQGDRLVLNDTKVMKARLACRLDSGGSAELLLMRPDAQDSWLALTKPARKMKVGRKLLIGDEASAQVVEELPDGMRRVKFEAPFDTDLLMEKYGQLPLPPYLEREAVAQDQKSYQTVYSSKLGAVAAPTAGLHFTEALLASLQEQGVQVVNVTLHVGWGTFSPVRVSDIREHKMHSEFCSLSHLSAEALNSRSQGRCICVGTTSLRCLESLADEQGRLLAGDSMSEIFFYPGRSFRVADGLITNFHLPRSTLLMLVAAFCGYDLMRQAYSYAIEKRFRFYSYGDAMLIV